MDAVDQEPEVNRYASAEKRMDALAKAINGFGQALAGMTANKKADREDVIEMKEQLMWMAKRLSWVEKQADPDWKPWKGETTE